MITAANRGEAGEILMRFHLKVWAGRYEIYRPNS